MSIDYSCVTETPANRASLEQLSRLYHRYRTASRYCSNKDVLEVACGAGMGLGYLAQTANSVVGGDYSQELLSAAREHYQERIPLIRLNAELLPFQDQCFDVVILFEAIYYLNSPDRFLNESRRVLKDDGVLLICTVNRNWTDFNPSPFSQRYLFGEELVANLRENNFEVELFGAFPATNDAKLDKVTSALKRTAINLNLMPRTMKGKELLKRIFFGQLHEIPSELSDGLVGYDDIHPIPSDADNSGFKIIYAIGYAR